MIKRKIIIVFCFVFFVLLSQTLSTIIDVFETTNGHEPRVAISCGNVPFHIDIETGKWTSDKDSVAVCDVNKIDVKKYCQKVYKKLNVSNIVEANKPVKIKNWCKPNKEQCNEAKKVTPYRCLVEDYEADALMVPKHCKFSHLHDETACLAHNEWRQRASDKCKSEYMKLNEYGILLSCGTDLFTGVEFVCCPKKHMKNKKKHMKKKNKHIKLSKVDKQGLEIAVIKFQKYLPPSTKGCDRTQYEYKRQQLEERHRKRIAAVVDEWDEAERRYKKLKERDPAAAAEKMNRTLEVFRETLSALEQEAKEERLRLREEHSQCISTSINKQKRESMLEYLMAVEERPHSVEKILQTVRAFIQSCEHDRLHSLRHFEHVRRHDESKAKDMRGNLLIHLKELNAVVNASINLMRFLPDVAKEFGLTTSDHLVIQPMTQLPTEEMHVDEPHHHSELPPILRKHLEDSKKKVITKQKEVTTKQKEVVPEIDNDTKDKFKKGTLQPTDEAPSQGKEKEIKKAEEMIKKATKTSKHTPASHKVEELEENDAIRKEDFQKTHKHAHPFFKSPRSPAAFAAVIGLGVGALVIMLGIIAALVVRRNRTQTPRVVLAEADNSDDREHLVKMQKNGYENPTYKFFYY